MDRTNAIGLDKAKTEELAKGLNDLLANYSVFYQNTRGYHWNVKGEQFFVLHEKFEELYNDQKLKIDEIAERILTLGHTPEHNYTKYVKVSQVKESGKVSDGNACVEGILAAFKIIISMQRALLDLSGEIGDEGTNSLMSDYITEQEKLVWMYAAHQSK
ncbi:DNA-binding ferritin-like protein (oxidative damage protectant) [Owenweeksia hongkongensis DSM 17368]|uniref:DNA-binding ferritin-like protein (Oxidative damage protectant) n=1 Tax=Owenweeksia hongkongensis (strain DSM 17368 / CIP 108786 / JCM 12287 / NRRL B-23963 / UST20020801) TaxID=926562 RepID=G8R5L2_OWEHD|nr:Dps family protein [Owenweeksia hongkongensis]AEV33286.1 DNA-binding ferritin-like protein (oxidative damage protectant) [Owenweeksia hongkongensis DSM 17368]